MLRLERRVQRVVERADGVTIMAEMGLGQRPGRLLLLTSDELPYSLADQRELQLRCLDWLGGWVEEQGIDPDLGEMLAGVLTNHVSSFGDARIQSALGALPGPERKRQEDALLQRCYRTVELLLGQKQGQAFRDAFAPLWREWSGGA